MAVTRPDFTGVWESDSVEGLDVFLQARGVSYLRRLLVVPLQQCVVQTLRHDSASLVQVAASRISTCTQLQRLDTDTLASDPAGARVLLTARWEGDTWVVLSRGADEDSGSFTPTASPVETRRSMVPGSNGLLMQFDLCTQQSGGGGAVVTARRRFTRVHWDCGAATPTPEQALQGSTKPGAAWSMLFGSSEERLYQCINVWARQGRQGHRRNDVTVRPARIDAAKRDFPASWRRPTAKRRQAGGRVTALEM